MHKGVYAGEIPPYDAPWFGGEARLWGIFAFFEGEGKRELFSGVDACMMERGGQTGRREGCGLPLADAAAFGDFFCAR